MHWKTASGLLAAAAWRFLARPTGQKGQKAWHDSNTMRACHEFKRVIESLRRHGHVTVYGDVSGLGKPMIDRLRELNIYVTPINNGAPPSERDVDKIYANKGTEIWFEAARIIERREVILEDLEFTTISQLTTRRVDYASQGHEEGRLLAEPKKKMKERGLRSPDRGDALCAVISINHLCDTVLWTAELAQAVVIPPPSPFRVPFVRF